MNAEAPKLTIQAEPLSDQLYLELEPLLHKEWEEVGHRKDLLKLDINLAFFDAAARAKRLAIFTLRDMGALAGYMIFVISNHPKYKTTIWGNLAGWWVSPVHRRPYVAKRLVAFAEDRMREYGVQFLAPAVRLDHPAAGKLLEAMGYQPYEVGYFKQL